MTTALNKKLRNEIEELEDEVRNLEERIELNASFDEELKTAAYKNQQELQTVKRLAAELCQHAILYRNFPTLAKQLRLTDDAINQYLRYIMNL